MNISLPEPLKQWVEKQVAEKGFSTASEFVRDVLRRQREQEVKDRIDRMLLEADLSEPTTMDARDWRGIRQAARARVAKRRRGK